MKNSNDFINESVFKVNVKYAKLQNKTEELFFQCLNEGRDTEYFYKKLEEIWGNIDHTFMNSEIDEYANIIERNNLDQLGIQEIPQDKKLNNKWLLLVGMGVVLANEEKFVNYIKRKYERYYNSPEYQNDKKEYLKSKIDVYDNQIIPYFNQYGEVVRYVQLSTYLAMLHNTNLTRTAWNETLNDAYSLGYTKFWIPPHNFSCEHCAEWQGKILDTLQVLDFVSNAEEQQGDILHPNCKCSLLIYTGNLIKPKYTLDETKEYYDIRQKVNSLTLKKERILTDMKICEELGFYDKFDELNSKRNVINSRIRELKNSLPTEEMRTKVTAINR